MPRTCPSSGVEAFADPRTGPRVHSRDRSNITRLEEWCKAHDMPEGTLQLEHLMQATKLLQLKKASLADIEIIFDGASALHSLARL